MKTTVILFSFAFAAAAAAQQTHTVPAGEKPVAVVNGEVITAAKLDQLYDEIGTQMRAQYDNAGGKQAFLENYIRKQLVIQEAKKTGFDKRPDVRKALEAARDAALFDQYIRDVLASKIVSDALIRTYYDDHPDEFKTPEQVHLRQISVAISTTGPNPQPADEALRKIEQVATQLHSLNMTTRGSTPDATAKLRAIEFGNLARKYSEDNSADAGGDLGWVSANQIDPEMAKAAFAMPVGIPSGIVRSSFGYHILFVEGKRPAGKESFDDVKASLREFLLTQKTPEVLAAVTQLTNELKAKGKITVYPENIR